MCGGSGTKVDCQVGEEGDDPSPSSRRVRGAAHGLGAAFVVEQDEPPGSIDVGSCCANRVMWGAREVAHLLHRLLGVRLGRHRITYREAGGLCLREVWSHTLGEKDDGSGAHRVPAGRLRELL